MNNNEDKLNPLAKKFEKIEKSQQEKKKSKKNVKIFNDPLELPEIDLFAVKKKESPQVIPSNIETIPKVKNENLTDELHVENVQEPSAASFIHPLEKKEENIIQKEEIHTSENVQPTAHIAQQRLQGLIRDDKEPVDSYDQEKGIASKLKVQPETSSMTLEEIKARKFIAKPEVKKTEKKKSGFLNNFLWCLIPALVSFLIILASENVKALINQNGFTGTFYLIILYFIFLSILVGSKFIISYYKPKSSKI